MTPRCSSPLAAKLAIFIGRSFSLSSRACQEMTAQNFAPGKSGSELPGIHDRQSKTARRHSVLVRLLILVEGNLHARDFTNIPHPRNQRCRRVAIAPPVGPKQYGTVCIAAIRFCKIPDAACVKPHHRIDPARAIEIRPLITHAQVSFDDAATDGLEIENTAVACKVLPNPCTAVSLNCGIGI